MNKIYLITSIMFLVSCLNKKTPVIIEVVNTPEIQLTSEIQSDISFGVRGNCGMCKSTIEAAAMSINGVDNASWSRESKIINININSDVNDKLLSDIHNAISKSGYDTEIILAVAEDYDKLPMCCKYDREMVIASND
ncbi:MAG: heavy-metal-associated domain-containing protein [Flavobacteriales bacterium]|jgi:mercuric ion binding protein|tara:strand:+ start:31991 stop:32401 length:411 start_codon:yes stop_codon:yes gene_type:complete